MVSIELAVVLAGFAGIGLPFALVGGVWVRRGIGRLRDRRAFQAAAMDTVSSVQAGQRAKLHGTVGEHGDGTVEAGISGVPAVAVRYVVVEERPDSDDGTDHRRVYEGARAVRCTLTDDTGTVVVDPDPETVDASEDNHDTVRVAAGEEPPERVARFIEATPELDPASEGFGSGLLNVGGRRRHYREWRIEPGDRVLVYGEGDRDPGADWGESLLVRTDEAADGLFTNYSPEAYADRDLSGIVGYLLLGGLLLVGPFAVLGYVLLEGGLL